MFHHVVFQDKTLEPIAVFHVHEVFLSSAQPHIAIFPPQVVFQYSEFTPIAIFPAHEVFDRRVSPHNATLFCPDVFDVSAACHTAVFENQLLTLRAQLHTAVFLIPVVFDKRA